MNNNNNNNNNINNIHKKFNITNGEKIKKVIRNSGNKLDKITSNSKEYIIDKIKDIGNTITNSTSNISWIVIFILFFYVFLL